MMTTTAAATSWHYQQARRAICDAGLLMVGEMFASCVVSGAGDRQVWLKASIIHDDETVLLTWRTVNGVEVARPIRLAIDKNLPAMLAALAAVEVNV